MLKSDLNLLGYTVFSAKPLPEWKNAYYLPMPVPRTTHYSFFIAGEPGEDICFAPVLSLIKERNPRAVIWVFTDRIGIQVFKGNPNVDRIITIPLEKWKKDIWDKAQEDMANWIANCRQGVGWVCNLSGKPVCALLARLVGGNRAFGLLMDEEGAPVIVGNRWMQYAIEVIYPNISDGLLCNENIMEKREMLSLALGLLCDKENKGVFIKQSSDVELYPFVKESFVAVCPSSEIETRRWPMEYWREFIEFIRRVYHINIVIINYSSEVIETNWLKQEGVFIVNTQDINRIAFLLARSKAFVSVHNGLIYLSGSLGIPTMVICGPRNKGPGFEGIHLSVRKDVPCAPCTLLSCSRKYCLQHLTPDQVFDVFRFHWDAISNGDFNDERVSKRDFLSRGLCVEVFDRRLPSGMYRYLPLTDNYTDEVIARVSRMAYLYAWNRSNSMLLKENIQIDFSRYIDWALERDVEWPQFESDIKSQIRGLKEWEQRLSLLIMRLSEMLPSFPMSLFKRTPIDPENLWDSLENFDNTMPVILKRLSYEEWDEDMSYSERVKYWVKVRRQLLILMREYRSFLEEFVFSRNNKIKKEEISKR